MQSGCLQEVGCTVLPLSEDGAGRDPGLTLLAAGR